MRHVKGSYLGEKIPSYDQRKYQDRRGKELDYAAILEESVYSGCYFLILPWSFH